MRNPTKWIQKKSTRKVGEVEGAITGISYQDETHTRPTSQRQPKERKKR